MIAQFLPSGRGRKQKVDLRKDLLLGTLGVTGHAHGEEPRQWVEHFKKGEVVEE